MSDPREPQAEPSTAPRETSAEEPKTEVASPHAPLFAALRASSPAGVLPGGGPPGSALPGAVRQQLGVALRDVAEFLRSRLAAPVEVQLARAPVDPEPPVIGFEFEGAFGVTLGGSGARLLVDGLSAKLGTPRGVGRLLGSELGLLEFLALEFVAAFAETGQGRGRALSEVRRREESAKVASEGRVGVTLALTLLGREASAWVWLPRWSAVDTLRFPAANAPGDTVAASFVLPTLHLTPAEADRAGPGDVVLLGLSAIEGAHGRLVTWSGWTLSSARVEFDSASLARVRCGELEARVLGTPDPHADGIPVHVSLGRLDLVQRDLDDWDGSTRELRRDPPGTVFVHLPERDACLAELVACGEEIGARLLRR